MMDEALDYLEKRQVFSFHIQNLLSPCYLYNKSVIHCVILVCIKTMLLRHLEVMLMSFIYQLFLDWILEVIFKLSKNVIY